MVEGRKILMETFIDQFFSARDVVNKLKLQFGKTINIDLLLKNVDGSDRTYNANIDKIDNYISEKYNCINLKMELNLLKV